MVINHVYKDNVWDFWDDIRPHVEMLEERFDGMETEDVFRRLIDGSAVLHLIDDVGFAICQWTVDKCFVLAAAAYEGSVKSVPDIMKTFAQYARSKGCKKLTFSSPRKGWGKIAPLAGMYVSSVEYTKDL